MSAIENNILEILPYCSSSQCIIEEKNKTNEEIKITKFVSNK